AANDSIFAIVAEKFGFVGVSVIIAMFATLFVRLTKITEKAPDDFSKLIVTGTLTWFSVQAIINIGAMLGLLPLKGITLPFISYGGTSLLFVMGTLGLIFQISKYRTLAGKIRVNNEDNANRRGQRRPHYSTVSRRV
ncbi:FtsW/RodA/SpoVE family cell cycle protein, partial [Candidatus Saccharibacteria bacterium]|nr:FtsW/RodA/SpoVE family cell cycle protein [Candidatus Saccharibacteria bacterium]